MMFQKHELPVLKEDESIAKKLVNIKNFVAKISLSDLYGYVT